MAHRRIARSPGFFDAARANPGHLTLATVPGGIAHIAFERLKRAANVDLTFVPYAGSAPAVNDLLGGQITSVLLPLAGLSEQVKSGPLRALASTYLTRTEALPDSPTISELGYKVYETDFWNGLLAPAKMPKETASQLSGWFVAAMQAPEVKARLSASKRATSSADLRTSGLSSFSRGRAAGRFP
jgi:tripartite-type tricarboxylate transporter receptor subunit TctC